VVNALDGISVKVGPGETKAKFRVSNVDQFLDWLLLTAERLEGGAVHG
jgi:trehalose-6-phosphatase